jgi:uncharacterized protein
MNRVNPPIRPLNDAERDRLDAILSRFRAKSAINSVEQIDGFFAALICSPEIAKPSQYLPEIWGGEMAGEEAFDNRHQFQDFLSLLQRHWNSVAATLEKGAIFHPLLFQDSEGIARGNDWAHGFMGGVNFHHQSWREMIADEEHGGALIPIMILMHEHDPNPEIRPYEDKINPELREKLIFGIAAAVMAIYRYFAP